jgi:hypothetical protein
LNASEVKLIYCTNLSKNAIPLASFSYINLKKQFYSYLHLQFGFL